MSTDTMLKGNELFQALSVEEVDRISALSSTKEFNTNDVIFVHDRPGTHIYVLMDGLVYLQLPSAIPEFNLSITKIQRGELFGLSPLLDSPRYTASAKCFTRTKVLAIEAKPVREILQKNYLVGMKVMSRVSRIYFNRYINLLKRLQETVSQISHVP